MGSGCTLVADSSRAKLDMMPVTLECHSPVPCVIRSSALGVNSGDVVYADAGSGGATSGDNSDGVVSAEALSGGATSGVDSGGAASANAGSGYLQWESIQAGLYLQTLFQVALHWESIQVALVSANVGSGGAASGNESGCVVPGIESGGTTSKGDVNVYKHVGWITLVSSMHMAHALWECNVCSVSAGCCDCFRYTDAFGHARRVYDVLAQSFGPCDWNLCSTWPRVYMDATY